MWNLQKAFSLRTIKVSRFEIIDGVQYVYCIKLAYKFLPREQVGFAAVLSRLRQCVSCCFFSVEPGRVILRRGHVGINFYFIYSGSVFVNVEDVNTRGEHFEKTETVLARGDSFGVYTRSLFCNH